jgi:hypothetical protein
VDPVAFDEWLVAINSTGLAVGQHPETPKQAERALRSAERRASELGV